MAGGYYELRNIVWPDYDAWAWDEEKDSVRNYLKRIWLKENYNQTETVEPSLQTVQLEKQHILEWWWTSRYTVEPLNITSLNFAIFLKHEYDAKQRVEADDNIVDGPRRRTVPFVPTDTKNYRY